MSPKKQIAIVDPHPVTMLGLTYLLESTNQFEVVVREVNSDKGFFQIVERLPDIVIMELELEGRGAITLADDIAYNHHDLLDGLRAGRPPAGQQEGEELGVSEPVGPVQIEACSGIVPGVGGCSGHGTACFARDVPGG